MCVGVAVGSVVAEAVGVGRLVGVDAMVGVAEGGMGRVGVLADRVDITPGAVCVGSGAAGVPPGWQATSASTTRTTVHSA